MVNDLPNEILPKSVNVLGMNMKESGKDVVGKLKSLITALASSDKVMVKIVTTMKVKYGFISLSFPPFTYENTLKNMMA